MARLSNGGIIGKPTTTPTLGSAVGKWNQSDQHIYKQQSKWTTTITSSGLVLHLDAANNNSYIGSGSTWTDLSGNNNHATLYNGVGYSSSNSGTLTFNESNQYGQIPSGMANFTNGITVCSMMNWGNVGSWERMIDFGNGSASDNILIGRQGGGQDFRVEIYQGVTMAFGQNWTSGITNNSWQFFSWSKSSTTSTIGLNGSYQSTNSSVLPNNISRSTNYIGRSNWADAYFGTGMQTLLIYNRALTEEEMTVNFNAYRSRFGI
jgi:hypothetical protein